VLGIGCQALILKKAQPIPLSSLDQYFHLP
jgi:hypothetical protein